MSEVLYSIEHANAALPLLRAIVTDVVRLEHTIVTTTRAYRRLKADPRKPQAELNYAQRELSELVAERDACAAELSELGVRLGDPARGVCDFPSELDGELVYLCWELGEERVEFYHALDAGYGERLPLPIPAAVS